MLGKGALAGGMPLYKFVGNKILTRFQNRVVRVAAVASGTPATARSRSRSSTTIPFEENSDGFDFDTEVLLQLYDAGAPVVEVPIPTYYGDEICRVDGLAYAKDVSLDVVRYRLARLGFGSSHLARSSTGYAWKDAPDASHRVALACVDEQPVGRVLDLGCGSGRSPRSCGRQAASSSGVDREPAPGTAGRVDRLVAADLDAGLPRAVAEEGPFDVVLALDVLEHLRDPDRLLRELHDVCSPEATLVASIPNIGHWYPRLRIGVGRFDYDHRGILDATHLRFFTWRSFSSLAYRAGWLVEERRLTGLPLEILDRDARNGSKRPVRTLVARIDSAGRAVWPSLFAYQYVAVLTRDPARLPSPSPARA